MWITLPKLRSFLKLFQLYIINVGDEVTLLNAVGGYGILTITKIVGIAYFQSQNLMAEIVGIKHFMFEDNLGNIPPL